MLNYQNPCFVIIVFTEQQEDILNSVKKYVNPCWNAKSHTLRVESRHEIGGVYVVNIQRTGIHHWDSDC